MCRSDAPSPALMSPQMSPPAIRPLRALSLPYFIPRNSRGALPVYSDIRNGRTRYLISVRNIQGDTNALANDLAKDLFVPGSPEAQRIKVQIIRSKHLLLAGGRWKHNIVHWLADKGF
ncbi:hypothetical protein FA95DRAFT_1578959 [Auriscalpium vulgare]|uniref:Uncharacterized protein n=1 Tax=Auriscalpium vulgare TaxID=40419 RepID=A0ACB8SD68_9AGAM|nr:hypothetical protein FA95DRAFT_1578959 [Auriscalpium vulgare]